jgi:hypothetical protein
MLVACRLAGLSALETYYAGVRAREQSRHVHGRFGAPPLCLRGLGRADRASTSKDRRACDDGRSGFSEAEEASERASYRPLAAFASARRPPPRAPSACPPPSRPRHPFSCRICLKTTVGLSRVEYVAYFVGFHSRASHCASARVYDNLTWAACVYP